MTNLFYLNGNREIPFTLKDLEEGKLIFEDDLIWYDGISNWTKACEIKILKPYLKKRPPLSASNQKLILIKKSLWPTILIYLIFSVSLGFFASTIEKQQYSTFYNIVRERHEKNEIKRTEDILQQLSNERIEEEKLEGLRKSIDSDNASILRIQYEIVQLNSIDYANLSDSLKKEIRKLSSHIELTQDRLSLMESGPPIDLSPDDNISLISYSIPQDEIYIYEDGKYTTRWCSYVSDNSFNENLSYENCHKFLFRPYRAIFDIANLSQKEIDNSAIFSVNMILSSLVSNIFLLFILIPFFYLRKKRDHLSKNKK